MPNIRHHNPFGVAQAQLLNYILLHPRCSFEDIFRNLFPDKHARYVHTLLHENRELIQKTTSADPNFPTEYQVKVAKLAEYVDVQHWVSTGQFKRKYIQGTMFTPEGVPYVELPRTGRQVITSTPNQPNPPQ